MFETPNQNLSSAAKTLLITLYIRAIESQRPAALGKDKRAKELVRQLDQESLRETLALTDDFSRVAAILKSRELDRFAQDFLSDVPIRDVPIRDVPIRDVPIRADGIHLLDEWGFFYRPEPRLAYIRWTRHIKAAIRTARIHPFQLGKAAG